jgi:hypothetical protein
VPRSGTPSGALCCEHGPSSRLGIHRGFIRVSSGSVKMVVGPAPESSCPSGSVFLSTSRVPGPFIGDSSGFHRVDVGSAQGPASSSHFPMGLSRTLGPSVSYPRRSRACSRGVVASLAWARRARIARFSEGSWMAAEDRCSVPPAVLQAPRWRSWSRPLGGPMTTTPPAPAPCVQTP